MLLTNGKKRIPIGYEDFKQLIDSGFYYVDKSMLIYELLHSGGQNNLITRPRRFGKTLNFSMLKYFFDINEKDNAYLFDGLKISEHYEELAMYRNTHPVITLSLKCAKQGDYREALRGLKYEIQRQFINNKFILDSDKLADEYKDEYKKIYKLATNIDLKNRTFVVDDITYKIRFNSIYNIYNFVAVISAVSLYDIDTSIIQKALSKFVLNNGRLEEVEINNIPTIINLAKNPTGCNVSLRILNEDDDEKELLFVLNDNIADGFDVSWILDINFDNLNNVKRIITSGKRAYDIAIRIKTSGFDASKIEAYLNLHEAVENLYKTNTKKYVIANYTSLQPTRKEIFNINQK